MKLDRKTLWRKRLGLSEPTGAKPKEKKRSVWTKKKTLAVVLSSAAALVLVATFLCLWFLLPRKSEGYYRYFRNFTSTPVTQAEKRTTLPEKTYVDSYDPVNDLYITAREYLLTGGESVTYYGIASAEGEYCPAVYTAILQMQGDYAIVARQRNKPTETATYSYLDLIRFRGTENAPYSLLSEESVIYDNQAKQFLFAGSYMVAYGTVHEVQAVPSYATFYRYDDLAEPLEVFRVRHAYDSGAGEVYTFAQYDDYVVGYTQDRVYYYNVNGSKFSGYLEERGDPYEPFGEMESLSTYSRDLKVFYMGNGWFLCSSMIYRTIPFNGFNILLLDQTFKHYARTKTEFYNVVTGATRSFPDLYCVENVANRYTYHLFTQEAFLYGSLSNYLVDGERHEYNLPFANPASMAQDGYSIVYYYYLPHIDEFPYDNEQFLGYAGEITYCILDENLSWTQPDNALMPTAYVDGVGITTSDPDFTETRGTAYAYDQYMKETVLATFKQGLESYIAYYANGTACIVSMTHPNADLESGAEELYGAVTPDGKRLLDFVYKELTFFSGGYALGYKNDAYYRIDEKGNETKIDDVYMIQQGTYIYKDGEKYGLKNYAGDVLIEAVEGYLQVGDVTMTKSGEAIRSFVTVRVGNLTTIYELK